MHSACSICGTQQKVMKRCVRCRAMFYCSKKCQIEDWKTHKLSCVECEPAITTEHLEKGSINKNEKGHGFVNPEEESEHLCIEGRNVKICVKCNHKKHELQLQNVNLVSGKKLMEIICSKLRIPLKSLKLITKGKLVTESNISELISEQKCKNFQAFGEEAEIEEGLDAGDIEAIMDELNVSRNQAIRSLRSCNGDLIDAIIELGNKI